MPDPSLALLHLQPVGEELENFRNRAVEPMRRLAVVRLASAVRQGAANGLGQAEPEPARDDDFDRPDGSPAQREGILRPRRLLADPKESADRVELVGQRKRGGHRLRRSAILPADRLRDRRRLALRLGGIPADHALKLREFPDHSRDEVRLGQPRRALDLIGVRALDDSLFGQPARELRHALDLVRHRSELFVKADPGELLGLLFERHFQVLLPEEAGVGEPRSKHATVALDDRLAAVLRIHVRDADERRRKPAVVPRACEIFLVGAHRQDDHLARNVEVIGIEAAEQRHRPFGEPGILDDEPFVLDEGQSGLPCGCGGAVADDPLAFLLVDEDVARPQLLGIIAGPAHGDLAGVMEPVADACCSRSNAVDRDRHDLLAEHGDDAVKRPHPAQRGGACRRVAPAHRLRPRKGANDPLDHRPQQVARRLPCGLDDREIDAVTIFELFASEPRLAQEAFQRLLRRIGAGPLQLFAPGRRFRRHSARDQRQPPRRRKDVDALAGEPGLLQLLRE